MKKGLLAAGILTLIAGITTLALAGLFYYAAFHTLDGSSSLFHKQLSVALIFLVIGLLLIGIGVTCLVLRAKRF